MKTFLNWASKWRHPRTRTSVIGRASGGLGRGKAEKEGGEKVKKKRIVHSLNANIIELII